MTPSFSAHVPSSRALFIGTAMLCALAVGACGARKSAPTRPPADLPDAAALDAATDAAPRDAGPGDDGSVDSSLTDGAPASDSGALPGTVFVDPSLGSAGDGLGGLASPDSTFVITHPLADALIPPTLPLLEVTFAPRGSAYALIAESGADRTEVRFACGTDASADRWCTCTLSQCTLRLDGPAWARITMRGRGETVTLSVRANTSDGLRESPPRSVRIARQDVLGGLYFWEFEPSRILRYEFARGAARAEPYLTPTRAGRECIGCHAIDASGTRLLVAGGPLEGAITVFDVATRAPLSRIGVTTTGYASAAFDAAGSRVAALQVTRGAGPVQTADLLIAELGPASVVATSAASGLRRGFGRDSSVDLSWSPTRDEIVYASIDQNAGGTITRSYLTSLQRTGATWIARDVIGRDADLDIPGATQVTNPTFVPGGEWLTFYERAPLDVYGQVKLIPRTGGTPIALVGPSPVDDGAGESFTNETALVRFSPVTYDEAGSPLVWGVVSTNRRLGTSDVGLQLWIFALYLDRATDGLDPSTTPVHLPFQDAGSRYLLAQWSTTVARQTCTSASDCETGERCDAGQCVFDLI